MVIYTCVKIGDGGKMSSVGIIKHAKDVAKTKCIIYLPPKR
jgi:hypothetical protein